MKLSALSPTRMLPLGVMILFMLISSAISAYGIFFATKVFVKRGKIYILIVLALIAATCVEILSNLRQIYASNTVAWYSIIGVSAVFYCYVLFVVNFLYVLRMNSLGSSVRFEKFAKYIPHIILLTGVLVYTAFVVFVLSPNVFSAPLYIASTIALFATALGLEIFLCFILIKKVILMLEYREDVQRKAIWKSKIYLVVIIILELSIFFVRIFAFDPSSPEGHIRVLGFLVRLLIVIDFYKDIITSIQTEDRSHSIMMRNFYSEQDSGLFVSTEGVWPEKQTATNATV